MYVNSPELVSQRDLVLTIPCSFIKKREREKTKAANSIYMSCHLASNLFVLYRMSQQELQDHLIYQHQLLWFSISYQLLRQLLIQMPESFIVFLKRNTGRFAVKEQDWPAVGKVGDDDNYDDDKRRLWGSWWWWYLWRRRTHVDEMLKTTTTITTDGTVKNMAGDG